jgi:hypothetical protein
MESKQEIDQWHPEKRFNPHYIRLGDFMPDVDEKKKEGAVEVTTTKFDRGSIESGSSDA